MKSRIQQLDQLIGSLESVALEEADIEHLEAGARLAAKAVEAKRDEREALLEEITNLDLRKRELAPFAERLEAAKTKQAAATKDVSDFLEFEAKRAELQSAIKAFEGLEQANQDAATSFKDAAILFTKAQSAVLRADLVDGEPCSVCGSIEHPWQGSEQKIVFSWADLENAKIAAEQANSEFESAKHDRDNVLVAVDNFGTRFDQANKASLDAAALAANQDLLKCESAHRELLEIAEDLDNPETGLRKRGADAQAALAGLEERKKSAANALSTALVKINNNLSGFESIGARLAAIDEEANAVRKLVECLEDIQVKERASAEAKKALDSELSKRGFPSLGDYANALLDETDFDELKQQLSSFEAKKKELTTLSQQERFANLPKKQRNLEADQLRFDATKESLGHAKEAVRGVEQKRETYTKKAPLSMPHCNELVKTLLRQQL